MRMSNVRDMTQGSEAKHIIMFAIPLIVSAILQQMFSIVDTVIVGKFVGTSAIGALGSSSSVLNLMISFAIGITMGGSVIISQYVGAKRYEKARTAISTIVIFMLVGAVILSAIGVFLARPILILLRTPESNLENAVTYLQIMLASLILMFGYNAFSAVMRGFGDSMSSLIFLIISTFINVATDILFVGVFRWGVAGAAWSTVLAQAICSIFCIIYIIKKVPVLRYGKGEFRFDRSEFNTFIKFGFASGIQQVLQALGFVLMQGLTNSFGDIATAGVKIANSVEGVAILSIINFSTAITLFTAQNIAAGKFDRIKTGLKKSFFINMALVAVITGVVIGLARYLVLIFKGPDVENFAEVLRISVKYLNTVGSFYWIGAIFFMLVAILRGSGDIKFVTYCTIFSLGTRVVSGYILSPFIGVACLWWCVPIGWFLAAGISFFRYRHGGWKTKSLIRVDENLEPLDIV